MNIVQRIMSVLTTAGLPGVAVRYGVLEEGSSHAPPQEPFVIVQRTGSLWDLDTTCGVERGLCSVSIQIDCYALDADTSARIAEAIRGKLADQSEFPLLPSLEFEFDGYEIGTRLWRTVQTWRCWDDDPLIAGPPVLEGGDLLLETGDPDAFLLEDDLDETSTILTEDAP
jgi:hypothetical protein